MSREAVLPDGTVLEFPDGTPDDVMDRTVRRHLGRTSVADVRASVDRARRPRQRFRAIEDAAVRGSVSDPLANAARVAQGGEPVRTPPRFTTARLFEDADPPPPPPPAPPTASGVGEIGRTPTGNLIDIGTSLIQRVAGIPFGLSGGMPQFAEAAEQAQRVEGPVGSFIRGATRSAVPTTAGVAAFGPGFTLGAAAGGATGPAAPVAVPLLGLLGGLGAAVGSSYLASEGQEAVLENVPNNLLVSIGQDQATRAADAANNPYAAFAGELSPQLLFMRPGFRSIPVADDASRLERFLANPAGGSAVGAGIGGGTELGRQVASDEELDWTRTLMATGAGALANRPTQAGQEVFTGGVNTTLSGLRRGARAAGETVGRFRGRSEPDFDNMRRAGASSTADPAEAPLLPARRPPEPEVPAPAPTPSPTPPAPTGAGAAAVAGAQPPARTLPDPGDLAEGEAYVSTASGDRVRTRMEVVDARDLTPASGELQPRDRTRASTDVQVQDIIGRFDPTRLGSSAEADRGAPIVGPDSIIESGNARTMALRRIYEDYPEQAAAYRRFIEEQGYSAEGVEQPVLVRRRVSDLDDAQRRQFVIEANRGAILEMTPTERARTDAGLLDGETLALYRGGDIGAAGNRDFVRAFQGRLPATEQGALIDSRGQINQAGIRRVESALMARAYENPEVLEKLLEARDNNVRSIGGAMLDASGPWSMMRTRAAEGEIAPAFDVTEQLVEATRIVSDARAAGTKINDLLSQQGMFGDIDPVTERFIRAFYAPNLTRAMGRNPIAKFLDDYIRRSSEQTTAPRLVGGDESLTPTDILDGLLADRQGQGAGLFDGETLAAAEDRAPRQRVRRGVAAERSGPVGPIASFDDLAVALDSAQPPARGSGAQKMAAARTSAQRPKVSDEELDTLQETVTDYRDRKLAQDAGPYDPEFLAHSFTNRTSIYDGAAVAAGFDPAEFRLLPSKTQVRELARVMKETFDITVKVKPGTQDRFAIDQMLDAYQNVQGMAFILGLPPKAMSLGGGLTLQLQKKARFLGAYAPGEETIILPGRSNSFAHEWGHAVDFHLLKVANDGYGAGFSGAIRQRGDKMAGGDLPPSHSVREAFVDLLNTMFFDEAALAARVMQLEKRIAATGSDKQRAAFQQQIDRIHAGASQMREGRSIFYRQARAMDGPGEEGAGTYWSSPTEMLARSFEAYVSNRAEAQGFTTEFIGKGDEAYLSDADNRFAKTFPKGAERDLIFAAYDVLFDRIAAEALLGPGRAYPPKALTSSRAQLFTPPPLPAGSWFSRMLGTEMGAWQDFFIRRAKHAEGRPDNPKGVIQKLQDTGSFFFYGMTARWKMLGRRYKAPTVTRLHDMLTHNTGDGKFTGRGFIHATRLRENQYLNRLDRALERHGIARKGGVRKELTTDEARILRDLLISERVKGAPANLVKLASELRRLEDDIFYELQRAGIDVGYTRNGHLQRMVDVPKVLGDEAGFLGKAAEVYEIVFDREWGSPADLIEGDNLKKFLQMARQLARRGNAVDVKPVAKIIRQINQLGDDADPAQLAALEAKLADAMGDLYDTAKSAFALQAADDWLLRIVSASPDEFDRTGPDSAFTKKRKLPPEADKILENFYINDPVEVIATYAKKAARRIEYATRFGHDNAKVNEMFDQMVREGVPTEDIGAIRDMFNLVVGRNQPRLPPGVNNLGSAIHAIWGTVALLPRAVLSSLAESLTAGIVMENPAHGVKALATLIEGALGTKNAVERREIARFIGMVESAGASEVLMNRFGGTYGDVTRWDNIAARMFYNTGLVALTRAQHTHIIGPAHAYLDGLAGRIIAGEKAAKGSRAHKHREDAIARYRELGIRDPEAFAKEIRAIGRLPSIEELAAAMEGRDGYAADWITAIDRIKDQVVQNPSVMDRPQAASSALGRLAYGIMSFNYSFWRNILKGSAIRAYQRARRAGAGYSAEKVAFGLLPAFGALLLAQTLVSTAREYLTNRKRWNERKEAGTLEDELIWLGFTRTLGTPLDPLVQGFTGLKYQRDITAVPLGPALGNVAQNLQAIAMPAVRNSPNTNTAEYNAIRGAYRLGVGPAVATGLSSAPGGPVVSAIYGLGTSYVTSPVASDEFAAMFVGEKDRRKPGRQRRRSPVQERLRNE